MSSSVSISMAGLVPWALLLSLTGCAVWTDCASRRIPNWLVAAGLLAGLAWQLAGPPGAWSFDPDRPGATGFWGWVLGGGALLAALFPLFVMRVMGGGDVKLMWAIGGIAGATPQHWIHLPWLVLSVLLAGGVLALVRMCRLGISARVLGDVVRLIAGPFSRGAVGDTHPNATADRMPYAVAIAFGAVGCIVAVSARWIVLA